MTLRGAPAWAKSWERYSVVLVIAVWLGVRALGVHFLGWGSGYDVGLYAQYGQQFGSGAGAYTEFHPEYPPGALPIFLIPLLWSGSADYTRAFAVEMACFDLAAAVLVLRCVQLQRRGHWLRPVLASLLYILVTAALYPVLYTRFDLAPGALVLAAVYCLHRRHLRGSALLLGIAGAVKLWPFALVPIWLGIGVQRRGMKGGLSNGFWIAAGAVLAALPVLPRAGWEALSFLKYHAARGIQIETTWSTVALLAGKLGVAVVQPEHNYGAFHVAGRLPAVFAALSMPLMILFALAPQVLAMLRGWKHWRDRDSERVVDDVVFGGTVGFLIAGKVLSPQYILWIAPLLPLVAGGLVGSLMALMTAVLTTVVYPYLSPALEQRVPGHGWALLAVGSRNLLLLGWYVRTTLRAAGWKPTSNTAARGGGP
jgi:Glycosyltransferase family 87